MTPRIFSGNPFGALAQALDAASLRQTTIAANLANVNTPGYRRKDVAFSLGAPLPQAPVVVTRGGGPMRIDGNNVDPDAEAARLAETEITFAALTQALSSQFSQLKLVINGSGR